MIYKNVNKWHDLSIIFAISAILIVSAFPASAGINFNYTNTEPHNYTITDSVLNSPNFVKMVGGDIEMPSLTLKFAIDKTIASGTRSLTLKSGSFGPKTTSLPDQKVFYVNPGGTATAVYFVDASDTFANKVVDVSTYKQANGNVPFFSDHSAALLNNIDDLKNLWNNDSEVLDEFLTIIDDASRINKTTITLDSFGDSGQISQNLVPGRYLVMVTKGTDPTEIIAWNTIIVLPFDSSFNIGNGAGTATQGIDLFVNVSLNPTAPAGDYTYATTIINRDDYKVKLGNISITWGPGQTLAQATSINGTILNDANALTDIIPLSNSAKITTDSKTVNMTLQTGALSSGSYLVNTFVFNSTNYSVAFDQSLLTLTAAPLITDISGDIDSLTGNLSRTVNISAPGGNVIITIFNGTNATLDGTPITNITTESLNQVNSTFVANMGINDKLIGENISLGPEGARFTPDIQIRFNYTHTQLTAAGILESQLSVKFYNTTTNSWVIQTTYNQNNTGDYIIVNVSHFSTYGLVGTTSSGGGGNNGGTSGGSGGGYSSVKPTPAPTSTVAAPTPTAAVISQTTTAPQPAVSAVSTTGTQQGITLTGILLGILGFALPSGEGGARNPVLIISLLAGILAVVAYRIFARRKR